MCLCLSNTLQDVFPHLQAQMRAGGSGDDLIIGGSTANDNDIASLEAAFAHWSASDLAAALVDLGSISDDGEQDDLSGHRGDDELFGGLGDTLRS